MTQRLLSATRMLAISLHTRRMPCIDNGVLCAVRMRVPEEVKDERKYSKNGKQGVSAALSAAWNSFCRRFLIHPPARKTEALLADYSLTIWSIQGTNHPTRFPLDVIVTLTDVICSCARSAGRSGGRIEGGGPLRSRAAERRRAAHAPLAAGPRPRARGLLRPAAAAAQATRFHHPHLRRRHATPPARHHRRYARTPLLPSLFFCC